MSNRKSCRLCESGDNPAVYFEYSGTKVPACRRCKHLAPVVVPAHPDSYQDLLTFDPISHDYDPNDGEVWYVGPEEHYYSVNLRSEQPEPVVCLNPSPHQRAEIPVTQKEESISAAIETGSLYRVKTNSSDITAKEVWWAFAIATAPGPFRVDDAQ